MPLNINPNAITFIAISIINIIVVIISIILNISIILLLGFDNGFSNANRRLEKIITNNMKYSKYLNFYNLWSVKRILLFLSKINKLFPKKKFIKNLLALNI